jgi:UDP-3-O-[3-hydroxymyristoyl] glucosamine N-acyltransferase
MKLSEIKKIINFQIEPNRFDSELNIKKLNTLKDGKHGELSFLENKLYVDDLKKSKVSAVLISPKNLELLPENIIPLVTEKPYIELAKLSKYFSTPIQIEAQFRIDEVVGANTKIESNVFIGSNVKIGNNVQIMHNSYIGDNVIVQDNSIIYPNTTIYKETIIGKNVIIHSGTVIGSDGFGFATEQGQHIKIYQNGNVIIEDNVEIGSNCTIDRATFNSTIIKKGVKIDNLVQIAHNCQIGDGSIIVSQVGISGSTILGNHVVMGGQSGTVGHIHIAPFSTITARTGITKSIKKSGKIWSGYPALEHKIWLKFQAKLSRLLKTLKN